MTYIYFFKGSWCDFEKFLIVNVCLIHIFQRRDFFFCVVFNWNIAVLLLLTKTIKIHLVNLNEAKMKW